MTIGELKKIIKNYPDSMQVLVSGYEFGYENPKKISVKKVQDMYPDAQFTTYAGRFDDYEEKYNDKNKCFDALIIERPV